MTAIITDPTYGYKRLDPIPSEEELAKYYQEKYFGLKLDKSAQKETADNQWLGMTSWADIVTELSRNGCKDILEIGCGVGDLGSMLRLNKFDYVGLEPCREAAKEVEKKDLDVMLCDLDYYYNNSNGHKHDAVIMMNVLEHVREPAKFISVAKSLLKPGGLLIVQVPNDFSILQMATDNYRRKPDKEFPYWVAIPDHINYFKLASLKAMVEGEGFDPFRVQSDYPMEFFLLEGLNYINNPSIGAHCHEIRVDFEMSLQMHGGRVSLYRLFAEAGIGRNILMFAREESNPDES